MGPGPVITPSHARRKLHDVAQSGAAPIAQEGMTQIQVLYRIEKDLRGLPADQRSAARQKRSKPIIDDFALWLAQSRAVSASLIETCKLNGIEPHGYLSGVLTAIAQGHKQTDINELMPWNHAKHV